MKNFIVLLILACAVPCFAAAGSGASKPNETSYRALTTRWFREQFPKAELVEINAAIGGTGSDLGRSDAGATC